jgi:hypothetical protein
MPVPSLSVVRENLESRLDELRAHVFGAQRVEVRAMAVQSVCDHLRRLGLCALLGEASLREYVAGLHASAQAYLHVLRQVKWDELVDSYSLCASRARPFYDAVAIEDWETARAIAAASAQQHAEEDESADDFAYARLLMACTAEGESARDAEAHWLARLEQTAPDGDFRVDVCRALHEKREDDFEEAFVRFLEERETEARKESKRSSADVEWKATERAVFIEGLALARVARRRDLTLAGTYRGLPPLALEPLRGGYPPADAWRTR